MPRVELRRYETDAQQEGLAELLCDPEVARHLLVTFTPEAGLAPNAARFRANFEQTWQRLGFGGLLIHEPGAPRPLGFVALKGHRVGGEEPAGAFEVYFGLAPARRGIGLAGEALEGFLAELVRRLPVSSLHASINQQLNRPGVRVLEKLGFAAERRIPLAELVGGALARGSLDLEIWRVARSPELADPEAALARLHDAAFKVGQLLAACGLARGDALERLRAAAEGGPLARALAPRARDQCLDRALDGGAAEAWYAVYRRDPSTISRSTPLQKTVLVASR